MSNGVPVSFLASGNMLYAESDVRDGSQVQFLYTKPYNLSTVANAAIAFSSLYEQNQDNIDGVEYSIDGGRSWLPVVYYLDNGGAIYLSADGTVDVVATMTTVPGDATATWVQNGVPEGGVYGAGLAAPITQALGRFIAPRINDDSIEGKRYEIYRIPAGSHQSDVRLRFFQLGTASWYFGVDNLGFYDVGAAATPVPRIGAVHSGTNSLTLSWIGAGTLLEATSPAGPWTVSASQTNPQTQPIIGTSKFFKIGPP
jgi:hypothetical protein